jgi:hypothetical protein
MNWLTWGSILFAMAAAMLWWLSAIVKTPKSFAVHVVRPNDPMRLPLGGNPLGGAYVGNAYSKDFSVFTDALRRQSKLSALAAICAGVSAALQAVALLS